MRSIIPKITFLIFAILLGPLSFAQKDCQSLYVELEEIRALDTSMYLKISALETFYQKMIKEGCEAGQFYALNEIGRIYREELLFDEAEKVMERAYESTKKFDKLWPKAAAAQILGTINFEKAAYNKAIAWYLKSITYFKAYDNHDNKRFFNIMDSYQNITGCYTIIGDFSVALNYCDTLKTYSRAQNDTLLDAYVKQTLSTIYIFQDKNPKRAIPILTELLAYYIEIKDNESALTIYEKLGDAYEMINELDSALYYYQIAGEISDSINDKRYLVAMNHNISELNDKINTQSKLRASWIIALISSIVALVLVAVLIIINIQNRRKLVKNQLDLQNQKVNRLLSEQELISTHAMLEGQDIERKRVAEELHDRLGGMLATVKLHFGALGKNIEHIADKELVQYKKADVLLDEACQEVRRISHDLHSGVLLKFGLTAAIKQLKTSIEEATDIQFNWVDAKKKKRLDFNTETNVYRIVQELVSNTLKHANASVITAQLTFERNQLTLMYEDNGKGFNPEKPVSEGVGLKNIRSRVERLKGNVFFDSRIGKGMTAIIEIPI